MMEKLEDHLDRSLGPRKFWLLVRSNRSLIVSISIASVFAAILLALVLPVKYRAQTIIVAIPDSSASSSLNSVQRSLASATGLAAGSDTRSYELVEIIKSERLTRDLITSEGLLPVLFYEQWDESKSEWKSDVPSMGLAFEEFDQLRTVEYSRKTGLISINMEWSDPVVAADWANKTVQHANAHLLGRDEREALTKLEYYEKQLENKSTINVRSSIVHLIQNEHETLATLKSREEYALKTIDPAFVPNRKFRPQRRVIVTMGLVLGFLASIGYVVLRDEYGHSANGED